jgi:hypothetical protein
VRSEIRRASGTGPGGKGQADLADRLAVERAGGERLIERIGDGIAELFQGRGRPERQFGHEEFLASQVDEGRGQVSDLAD